MANLNPRKNQITEAQLLNWRIHSLSPYNDGWTQEMYSNLYNEGLKKLERSKKRSEKKKINEESQNNPS